jgi:type I restriction enzyme S subunit
VDKIKDTPDIRFAGFTNAWEQRKLGEVVEDYVEKTTVQNQYPVLTSSQQRGIVFQEDYFADRQVTTSENIGYFVLPKGYFTYRSRSDNDVFVFNRNDLINKGIISYFYPVFKPREVDSDFLLRRLNYGIERQMAIAAEGTGQRVLSLKKFKSIVAMFPTVEEQTRIGQLFTALDNLLTLHQRELEKLQNMKKALLEKMFV